MLGLVLGVGLGAPRADRAQHDRDAVLGLLAAAQQLAGVGVRGERHGDSVCVET